MKTKIELVIGEEYEFRDTLLENWEVGILQNSSNGDGFRYQSRCGDKHEWWREIREVVKDQVDSNPKPVFTQDMFNDKKFPPIGSEIIARYMHDSKTVVHQGEVLYISINHLILLVGGLDICLRIGDYQCEPIKSHEDKLREALNSVICSEETIIDPILMEALLTSNKFTITLNDKGT